MVANYTDYAIGSFIDYLKSRPDFDETMIVITGDHEGLASDRMLLCQSKEGKGIVSDKPFTPFIIVNSPIGIRYEAVMGQIDMYPTILNLMYLDDYIWKGMGQSILDKEKKPLAVSPQMDLEGNTEGVTSGEIQRLKNAYRISDLLIRFNYFQPKRIEFCELH